MEATTERINAVATRIVLACVKVHRHLGPGLLESAYQQCLAYDLTNRGLRVEQQLVLPIRYGDITIDAGYRLDMLVEDLIIIENKSVLSVHPVHDAQLLTYLRLTDRKLGFLINWNVPVIKDGIRRLANGLIKHR